METHLLKRRTPGDIVRPAVAGQEAKEENDALLVPLLLATNDAEAERVIALLISEHAGPVSKPIIRHRLRSFGKQGYPKEDIEDVYGDVIVRLLKRLQELRDDPDLKPIHSFDGYVKTVTINACSEYLRNKHPRRASLQDRLRYLLTHRQGLGLWKDKDEWWCGLDRWQHQAVPPDALPRLRELRDRPGSLNGSALRNRDAARLPLPELVEALCGWLN